MAARSSGFRMDELGSAPAALMSSSTAASHEKVRRAEGTCGGQSHPDCHLIPCEGPAGSPDGRVSLEMPPPGRSHQNQAEPQVPTQAPTPFRAAELHLPH